MNRDNLVAFYEADLARYGPNDARSLHWVGQRTQWARFEALYEIGSWEAVSVADIGCGLGDLAGFLTAKGHQLKPGPGPDNRSTAAAAPQQQHRSTAAPQHPNTAAPQHPNTAAPQTAAPQHRSTAAPQHPNTAAPQTAAPQHPNTAAPQTAAPQHRNTPNRSTIWYNGYDVTPAMVQAARRKYPQGAFHLRDILSQGFVGRPDYVVASGTFNIRLEDHERWFRDMIAAMYAACRRGVAFNFLGLPDDFTAESAEDAEKGKTRNSAPSASSAVNKGGGEGWEPLARWTTIYYEARPQDVLSFCRDLAPRVDMKSGYLADDYTISMYRS